MSERNASMHRLLPTQVMPHQSSSGEGGKLAPVTVTGYLIPRVGEEPQPETNYDQEHIQKTGYQTVTDLVQDLPAAVRNFLPAVTAGISFSPSSVSIGFKGGPPN